MKPLALITGGTSGIGLATAHRLAADYQLALIYAHDEARSAAVEAETGHKVWRIDVGCDQSVAAGYADLVSHFGASPEVLVNAAGIASFQRFFVQGRDLEPARAMMNVNYYGTLRMVAQVLPAMYSRRRGSIVNVSSASGLGGWAGVIGYAESKAAVRCFTQNLAMEVGHRGLAVNCVSPGRVATPMTAGFLDQFKPASVNPPLGRPLAPDEVAVAIEFLVRAGPAMNGQNLVVDGGTTLARIQARKAT